MKLIFTRYVISRFVRGHRVPLVSGLPSAKGGQGSSRAMTDAAFIITNNYFVNYIYQKAHLLRKVAFLNKDEPSFLLSYFFLLEMPNKPSKPEPSNNMLAGSGTTVASSHFVDPTLTPTPPKETRTLSVPAGAVALSVN